MQRELEEEERALEQQRKKDEETRARLEAMERILNAGYQPHPRPYILRPEQTPQVPHMGNMDYYSNSGYSSMPMMDSAFGSLSHGFLNQFQSSGGSSRGVNRGGSRGGNRGGSRGGTRPEDTVEPEDEDDDDDDDNDEFDNDNPNFYHNGVRRPDM
ncbi:unnamed protein product [Cuscuta epithymum]|uniref:Uncharacterized protein n=1 Tax=Cuscuta epithymum TaxID=186058 RepID=A0AAV0CTZ8_9ASTE|nr:unnamed protein product [Cuscuta epithymum]